MGAWEECSCYQVRRFYVSGVGWVVEFHCTCPDDSSITIQSQMVEPYTQEELNAWIIKALTSVGCPTYEEPECGTITLIKVEPEHPQMNEIFTVKIFYLAGVQGRFRVFISYNGVDMACSDYKTLLKGTAYMQSVQGRMTEETMTWEASLRKEI